ncbi:non-ribosomal peptide synthetase, partial [Gordonia sp. (in: high G+C Gram-positive bacteria)]|uniref:non-ribosomal peptide synthetase n=1 Tax=Gordonia sp. (in: high G+C Gram-positive bacteria) TaxID=84139 RepID=UPI0019C8226A
SRLYRTGDLVRWNTDGTIEYLGRTDFQVKLRGQRIELGEIEAVLAAAPGVVHAAATVAATETGAEHLVAYLAPAGVDVDAVKAAAEHALPNYMVPSVWMVIDEVPLNSAGKLDRRALPAPDFGALSADYVAPLGAVEELLASIVAGLLGVDRISVTESFFALGGDSIMSIQLASAVRAAGFNLSPREIFERRTVRGMAAAITDTSARLPELAEPDGGAVGVMPVPSVVSWMLEHSDTAADFADFNQSATLAAPKGLTEDVLAELLGELVAHHPMLSASLVPTTSPTAGWELVAGREFDAAAAVSSLTSEHAIGTDGFDADLQSAHVAATRRFNTATGQLVQAVLVTDATTGAARIVLTVHHLGVDAVSWRAIIEDLVTLWAQRSGGHRYQLRATTTSQRAWMTALAGRTDAHIAEADYWLDRLPEHRNNFGTELDPARDRQHTTVTVTGQIDATVTEAILTSVPDAFGSKATAGNVNDVLLGSLARAVRAWQHDRGLVDHAPISVLTEGHGRYEDVLETGPEPVRADLSRSVGWFTSIAPLALDPAADIVHAIKAAKEERLAQPDSGIGFGWLRYNNVTSPVAALAPVAGLAERPLPAILFNYLGAAGAGADSGDPLPLSGVRGPVYDPAPTGAMAALAALNLSVGVAVGDDGSRRLNVIANVPRAILSEADVDDLIGFWAAELTSAVDAVAHTSPGLSPSDVPGVDISQDDLDDLAVRYPGSDVWALAPLQRGLYFQAELGHAAADDAAVDVYLTQVVLHLGSTVDVTRLRGAVDEMVSRHRVLRSGFVRTRGGSVVGLIQPSVEVPWQTIDLGDMSGTDARARIAEIGIEQKTVPFDLAAPPLLRVVVVRHADGIGVVITNHHILFDGWSGPLVLADLLALYATGDVFTVDTGHDFADFLAAVAAKDTTAGLAAWRGVVERADGATLVAPGIEATVDSMPRKHAAVLGSEIVAALESVARKHNSTIATTLQTAWAILLSRITGNRVVTFGETVSGRPADLPGVETMVGLFINTLPVVVDVDPNAPVAAVIEQVQADKVAVLDHQYLTLPEILATTAVPAGFDTLTIHESYPVNTESLSAADTGAAAGLRILEVEASDATHYPLNMVTAPVADGLSVEIKYLPGAFADDQIQVFADALLQILCGIAADADRVCGDIELLNSAQLAVVEAAEWGDRVDVQSATTLDSPVFAQVTRTPEATALWFEGRSVSYAEFGARVSVLARELISLGVGPDTAVALCIPRSVEMVVAIHAIVAAGGQYVPIGLGTPTDRVEYMVETAAAELVLAVETTAPAMAQVRGPQAMSAGTAQGNGIHIHLVDCSGDVDLATPAITAADRLAPVSPDNAAYSLFTSGSTGRPKGVTLSHRAVLNRLWWGLDELPIDQSDTVILKTPYTFDVSVPELFAPLMAGARLVILKEGGHTEPLYVAEVIEDTRATMVHFVPSMLSVFVDVVGTHRISAMDSVRIISLTGEAVPPAVAAQVREALPNILFYNLYGPTEAAIEITAENIKRAMASDASVPIGVPIWNSSALVLDARLQRVPAGVPGELYLGGVQLARGYASRGDLTADRFIADPCGEPGTRMYRTGDLVRRRTDGVLEYLGRTDFQVKLRGQRVELGEIESAIASSPGVVHAAATVLESATGDQHLIGYVSPASVDTEAVRASVAQSLPVYMVPTVWVGIDDVTLNSAGKLDRKALPAPDFETVAAEFVAPATAVEAALSTAFADVLGADRVSVAGSFFDLGGNSLSAMRLAARASEILGVEVTVRDVFTAPTVRELIAATTDHAGALVPVTKADPRPERIPLSFAQQRMWFINQFDTSATAYNIPVVLRLSGTLDVPALRAAIIDVLNRHEILRTVFPAVDGVPHQVIGDIAEFDGRGIWRTVHSDDDLFASVASGFDVTREWPVRVVLRETSGGTAPEVNEYLLAVVAHHIAADGESMRPLVTDIVTAYVARVAGVAPEFVPLDVQFADFAIWQHRVLGSPGDADSVAGRQLGYWREQLAGVPDVLALPTDRPRPPVASQRGGRVQFAIPASLCARIERTAAGHGVTSFMVVHGALAVLLARLTASDDITIGTPVAGRGQAALDRLVGMFVNTLVLRTRMDLGARFIDVLADVKDTDLAAFTHDSVPFEAVVDAVSPVRSEAFAPLTQVWLSLFQNAAETAPSGRDAAAGDDLMVSAVDLDAAPVQVDLIIEIAVNEPGTGWFGSARFATDLFDEPTVESMMSRLIMVLDAVTRDSSVVVGDVALLDDAGATWVAELAHGADLIGAEPYSVTGSIPATLADVVVQRVAACPSSPALIAGEVTLSYAELGSAVAALALRLGELGVGVEDAVAVCLPRSVSLAVAVYAVAVAGAQFVPVDPESLADRMSYIVETAGARVVLVPAGGGSEQVAVAVERTGVRIVEVDDAQVIATARAGDSVPLGEVARACDVDAAAYTMFTSGSTGRPKGVVVSHRSVVTHLRHDVAVNGFTDRDVFAQVLSFTFDPAVLEFFRPIAVGGSLVMLTGDEHRDPTALVALWARHRVNTVIVVPSMLATIMEVVDDAVLRTIGLRVLCVGGEPMPQMLVDRVAHIWPAVVVANQYGPTEATIYATRAQLSAHRPVTIGAPVSRTVARVLDGRLHPVPVGVAGELYLGGALVARGYAGRSALTAERFIADRFGDAGDRLYRTGDIVRWNTDGDLEYVGRTDFQVKLRGQRVELGEIEAVLVAAPGVSHAAVTLVGKGEDAVLVGYVSPSSVDIDAVKAHAAASLAGFMVPAVWAPVEHMPLNAAGKIDRTQLPAPDIEGDRATRFVAPHTGSEHVLVTVFAELLGVERVSVTESFFDIGGNSLSAMRLAARASAALGVNVSVRDVFAAPSVRELIAVVSGHGAALVPITKADPRPDRIPLSFAQQRMWFLNQFDPTQPTYNIPAVLRINGDLDVDALRESVTDLLVRHEVLRTSFPVVNGEPAQVVGDIAEFADRDVWSIVEAEQDLTNTVTSGFDVTTDWPIRIRLLRSNTDEFILAVVVHHIASDGESMLPLVTDLTVAYAARVQGKAPDFTPLEVQFADYAIWQHSVLGSAADPESTVGRQLGYWRDQLTGAPDVLDLPADRPRPLVASHRGARADFQIPAEVGARVEAVAREHGVTPFMVVHAALSTLLARLSATADITVATPIAGRGDRVLDPLVGMFVNTLVLRTEVFAGVSFAELLEQVRTVDLDAFAHSDVPFETIVEALDPVRSEAFSPLAQVMLSYDPAASVADTEVSVAGLEISPLAAPIVPAQLDLSVLVAPRGDGLDWAGSVVFATELFEESTVLSMADKFVRLLDVLTADTSIAVGDASWLSADTVRAALDAATGPEVVVPRGTVADALVARAASTPELSALWFEGRSVSYAELSART